MKLVVIESPYAGATPEIRIANRAYVRRAIADSLSKNEAPFASHALYTLPGVLDDNDPEQRAHGMEAGFAWGEKADLVAVYADRGVSPGMEKGITRAIFNNIAIEYRYLDAGPADKKAS